MELHRAASSDEGIRKQRELARPADELVLLGGEIFESGGRRVRLTDRDRGAAHGYSVTMSRSCARYTYSRIRTRRSAKMKKVNSMKPVSGCAPSAQMKRNT